MGTMVGDDGASNQIGVAPDARWIGCRNMNENGEGTPASYAECFEFFVAPTRIDGSDPDPARAPHVINNSWICPPAEGCIDPNALESVVQNTRAAGIVVVTSAGNDGPGCSSIDSPPGIYDVAVTVGATNDTDAIWGQSSRGGVSVDGSQRLKPNLTAPGVSVRSSSPNGGYSFMSGTSMAAPHVAGQIALLISAVPGMAGRPATLETCIEATAVPLSTTQNCSGISGDHIPNNTYGRGRIALSLPLPAECSGSFVFSDDFETGQPSGWN
jgi:subtilisin family serine protease